MGDQLWQSLCDHIWCVCWELTVFSPAGRRDLKVGGVNVEGFAFQHPTWPSGGIPSDYVIQSPPFSLEQQHFEQGHTPHPTTPTTPHHFPAHYAPPPSYPAPSPTTPTSYHPALHQTTPTLLQTTPTPSHSQLILHQAPAPAHEVVSQDILLPSGHCSGQKACPKGCPKGCPKRCPDFLLSSSDRHLHFFIFLDLPATSRPCLSPHSAHRPAPHLLRPRPSRHAHLGGVTPSLRPHPPCEQRGECECGGGSVCDGQPLGGDGERGRDDARAS